MSAKLVCTVVESGNVVVERDGEIAAVLAPETVAAAPAMLEALKGLLGLSEGQIGASFAERMEKARAAIAAAEPEAGND